MTPSLVCHVRVSAVNAPERASLSVAAPLPFAAGLQMGMIFTTHWYPRLTLVSPSLVHPASLTGQRQSRNFRVWILFMREEQDASLLAALWDISLKALATAYD